MTDSRLDRIINQLADFDENELNFIVEKICLEREKKRKAKIDNLIENFRKAWEELTREGVVICYCEYIDEGCDLDINNFEFY